MAASSSNAAERVILDRSSEQSELDISQDSVIADKLEVLNLANKATELEKVYIDSTKRRKSEANSLLVANNLEIFNEAEKLLREKLDEITEQHLNPKEKEAILKSISDQNSKLQALLLSVKDKNLRQSLDKGIENLIKNYQGLENFNQQYIGVIVFILRSVTALEQERLTKELNKFEHLQHNASVFSNERFPEEDVDQDRLLQAAKGRIEYFEENTRQLENKITSLNKLIEHQNKLIEETDVETTNLENRQAVSDLQKRIRERDQEIAHQQVQIQLGQQSEQTLNNRLEKANQRIHTLVDANKDYQIKLSDLTDVLQKTEKDLVSCNKAYQSLEGKFRTASEEFDKKEGEESNHLGNLSVFEGKLEEINKDLKEIKGILSDNQDLLIKTTDVIKISVNKSANRTGVSLANELSLLDHETSSFSSEGDQFEDSLYIGVSGTTSLPQLKETVLLLEKALKSKEGENNITKQQLLEANDQIERQNIELQKLIRTNNKIKETAQDNQGEQSEMANTELARKFDQIISRDEKKEIPFYDGEAEDVHKWLQQAERVANNNDWSMDQKVRYFSDRLKGEALEWHNEYMEKPCDEQQPPKSIPKLLITYGTWKHNFIKRFEDEADIERIKNHLKTLKQKTGQNVKSYIAIINRLYNRVNGKGVQLPDRATLNEIALCKENYNLRDKEKLEILLSGLTHALKEAVWIRMPANRTYDTVCKLATEVESILLNKELTENKGISALVAGISLHEQEQDFEISKQRAELANLQKQLGEIRLTETFNQVMDKNPLIAAVDKYDNQRPVPEPKKENNYYSYPRDRSRSRDTDRDYRREFSRSASPGQPRYLRQNQERNFSGERQQRPDQDRVRFAGNWRERSLSNNRSVSQERPTNSYNNYQSLRNNNIGAQDQIAARGNFRFQRPNQFSENQFREQQGRREPFNQIQNNQQAPTNVVCYFCKRTGHIQRQCRTRLRAMRQTQGMGPQNQVIH